MIFPKQNEWTIPLLRSVQELYAHNWEVFYDDETSEGCDDEDIYFMIKDVYYIQ